MLLIFSRESYHNDGGFLNIAEEIKQHKSPLELRSSGDHIFLSIQHDKFAQILDDCPSVYCHSAGS